MVRGSQHTNFEDEGEECCGANVEQRGAVVNGFHRYFGGYCRFVVVHKAILWAMWPTVNYH